MYICMYIIGTLCYPGLRVTYPRVNPKEKFRLVKMPIQLQGLITSQNCVKSMTGLGFQVHAFRTRSYSRLHISAYPMHVLCSTTCKISTDYPNLERVILICAEFSGQQTVKMVFAIKIYYSLNYYCRQTMQKKIAQKSAYL